MPRKTSEISATSSDRIKKAKQRPKIRPCPICLDPTRPSQLVSLTTTCACTYCKPCLRELVTLSLLPDTSPTLNATKKFTAICCGSQLDMRDPTISKALTAKIRKAYWKKFDEMSASQPLHCGNIDCRAFLLDLADEINALPDSEDRRVADLGFVTCGKCHMKTCKEEKCRKLRSEHLGVHVICPVKLLDLGLEQLAKQMKWKRCPNCRAMIEKVSGCHSIRCTSRTEFCYDCGKMTKATVAEEKWCKCGVAEVGLMGNIGTLLGFDAN